MPNLLTANAPGVGLSDLVVPRGPNYREASKVKAVGEIFGMRYIAHSDMPPNEIHLVQDDQCVGKIILSESRHNRQALRRRRYERNIRMSATSKSGAGVCGERRSRSQQRRVKRHRKAKLFSQQQMMAWARYVTNGRYSESALQGSFTQWHDGPEFKTLTEWK